MAISLRLPQEVEKRLTRLATATGRSKTFYALQAIVEKLDELEKVYLAEQRLIDARSSKAKSTVKEVSQ